MHRGQYIRRDNPSDIDDLAVRLSEQRGLIERCLVGALLTDPARGAGFAIAAGVDLTLLENEALAVVADSARFLATERFLTGFVADDQREVVYLAMYRLAFRGLWHRGEPGGVGLGPQSLVDLFSYRPEGPQDAWVRCWSRRLVEIDQRQREAQEHYKMMIGALVGRRIAA